MIKYEPWMFVAMEESGYMDDDTKENSIYDKKGDRWASLSE